MFPGSSCFETMTWLQPRSRTTTVSERLATSTARLFCHGEETKGVKIGSRVSVEDVNSVYYFSNMGFADRARLFWRRAGARGEKVAAISKSLVQGLLKGRSSGQP